MNKPSAVSGKSLIDHVNDQFQAHELLREESEVRLHIIGLIEKVLKSDEAFFILDAEGRKVTTTLQAFVDYTDPVYGGAPSFDFERKARIGLGNLILFYLGAYPEWIERHPILGTMPQPDDLRQLGKESYQIASIFDLFEYKKTAKLFAKLATLFDICVYALRMAKQAFLEQNNLLQTKSGGSIQ
jgi:hypothetical protein